jgi:hypothetical protein
MAPQALRQRPTITVSGRHLERRDLGGQPQAEAEVLVVEPEHALARAAEA